MNITVKYMYIAPGVVLIPCHVRERPFDFSVGGGGQEDVFRPGNYFFHLKHDPVFLQAQ